MKVPTCRIHALGEQSNWAKQFLNHLQNQQVVDIHYEPSVQRFCEATTPRAGIVFIEHAPDMKTAILKLRKCGKNLFIIWYGKLFSKEDYAFAMENRVYWILENSRPDEKRVLEGIKRASHGLDIVQNFDQHFHSMKAILLQGEADESMQPLLQEIKSALGKLERTGVFNEFLGEHCDDRQVGETKLPFHQSQDVSDALMTVHDLERTGVLTVRGIEEGRVEFLQGKIVAAQAGEVRGLKALFRMFLWDDPQYSFHRIDPADYVFGGRLDVSLKHLCDEAIDLRNRFTKIRRELPPPDLELELEASALHTGTQLNPTEFSTLSTVIEFQRVAEVLDYNPLPDVLIYEALIDLRKRKVIRVAA